MSGQATRRVRNRVSSSRMRPKNDSPSWVRMAIPSCGMAPTSGLVEVLAGDAEKARELARVPMIVRARKRSLS